MKCYICEEDDGSVCAEVVLGGVSYYVHNACALDAFEVARADFSDDEPLDAAKERDIAEMTYTVTKALADEMDKRGRGSAAVELRELAEEHRNEKVPGPRLVNEPINVPMQQNFHSEESFKVSEQLKAGDLSVLNNTLSPPVLMVHDSLEVRVVKDTLETKPPFTVNDKAVWRNDAGETWPAEIVEVAEGRVSSRELNNRSTRHFTLWADGKWRCGAMTLHPTEADAAPVPATAMDVHKALRAAGLSYEDSKRTALKAARVDDLESGLRRLLQYPLALIVHRRDIREAARLAGIKEPAWPVTDENMNTRVLLDKELLAQNARIKQAVCNFAYGVHDPSLYALCEAAGVATQDWMKQRKADQNLVEHLQVIMSHVVAINDAICEHGMDLGPQYVNEHISAIIVKHRPFEQEGWPYKKE